MTVAADSDHPGLGTSGATKSDPVLAGSGSLDEPGEIPGTDETDALEERRE